PKLQKNLLVRSALNRAAREYLSGNRFVEVETPFMVKYTPGGARNFLVPSRLYAGHFYALAESPQLYKQMLMIAGFDRYYQIVRCFRDEDLRIDRQPEFTQIDIEMSFINQDDLFRTVEGLVFKLFRDALGVDLTERYPGGAFPRLDFAESMAKYGNDKPDLRFDLPHTDLTAQTVEHDVRGIGMLEHRAARLKRGEDRLDVPRQIVKAIRIPKEHAFSRKELQDLEKYVTQMGAKGLARAKVDEGGQWVQSPLAKTVTDAFRLAVNEAVGAEDGDMLFFQFGPEAKVQTVMANLRVHLAKKFGLIPETGSGGDWNFLWVVNPPLFE